MNKGPAHPASSTTSVIDEILERSCQRAQLDDLGSDSWREGLSILVDTVESTPDVSPKGRDDLYSQFVDSLWNRLRVVEYGKRHPEVTEERIERPLVILGLPRTGTTLASDLLDRDPNRRSLLNWEAPDSVPPATTATLRSDQRCLVKKVQLDEMAAALREAQVPIPHWEEADGPTECSFVLNQDFKALLWEIMMPTPAYNDWFLDADMTSAYQYERLVLQVLQSQAPGVWSLKMPSHAVHVDALLAIFPDVRIVWAHRDPFRATASYLTLNELARPIIGGPDFDVASVLPWVLRQLQAHVERPLRARTRIGSDRFYDLHYAKLMQDPIAELRALYDWAGDPLSPDVEKAMLDWLDHHPQDRFGRRPYSLEQFGVTGADLRPVFDEYLSTFDIEPEGS